MRSSERHTAPSVEFSTGITPKSAAPDSTVSLAHRGKIFAAKVAPMPFVPHRYHRKGAAA